MARYLVTGGCGFIGSHLVEALLATGHETVVIDDLSNGKSTNLDARARLIVGDITDRNLVETAMVGIQGCFHLAAIPSIGRSTEDWLGTHRTNLTGTIAVLDAARKKKLGGNPIPVVYTSSAAVYGDAPQAPTTETMPTAPLTAYGADKLGSELHARVAWNVHKVPATSLRIFNAYGPRQDPQSSYSGVISIFAACAAANLPIKIHGDGQQLRDFVHVADVVAHLLAAMVTNTAGYRCFNVCSGRATSILDLARLVGEISGTKAGVAHNPARAGDIRRSVGDPARAIAELGVSVSRSLETGVVEFYKSLI